jgi:hypothetical protein
MISNVSFSYPIYRRIAKKVSSSRNPFGDSRMLARELKIKKAPEI